MADEEEPKNEPAGASTLETVPEEAEGAAGAGEGKENAAAADVPQNEAADKGEAVGGEQEMAEKTETGEAASAAEKVSLKDEAAAEEKKTPGDKKTSIETDKFDRRQSKRLPSEAGSYKREPSKKSLEIMSSKRGPESKDLLVKRQSDRASKAKIVLGSIISLKRNSTIGEFLDRSKVPRFMNSYKLDSDKPFEVGRVEKILRTVLMEVMENMVYDPDKCPQQAKYACSAIRAKVKEHEFDRYKIVVIVTFGEKQSQDMLCTCRFLWDCERDKYAVFTHENVHVFGMALCFGIYYE